MNALELLNFIVAGVPYMIQLYADNYNRTDERETLSELAGDLSLPRIRVYDYIIVGGGTAGCLLAERLSRTLSVLLLESGGYPVPATYNSFLFNEFEGSTVINNQFDMVPQQRFASGTNGVYTFRTGKMLGGSGSHNGNVYNRGSPYSYDFFAKFTGDPSLKYENMMKYFKRFENFRGWLLNETEWWDFGHSGDFVIEKAYSPLSPLWFGAGTELGFQIAEPNSHQRVSFDPLDESEYNAVRSSSYTAFIKPIDGRRPTLRVLKYSTVDQTLIKDGTAYGVTYSRHGIPQIAHASREVIVSAGSIGSPILLMKSGIGPLETLQSAGIPVHSALPAVGRNFKDHVAYTVKFKINNAGEYAKYFPTTTTQLEEELKEYQLNKRGYFTDVNFGEAFIASSRAKGAGEAGFPDIQFIFENDRLSEDSPTVCVEVTQVRPYSVGQIGLNTTAYLQGKRDYTKLALIDPRYFSDESDMTVMLEGIRLAIQVMTRTRAFAPLNVTLDVVTPPPCRISQEGSDEYWKCVVESEGATRWHYTSTNRMGADGDPTSVLYTNFTVKGVRRLRVVDASVLPTITNSNTNTPTLAFAEKAAESILSTPHVFYSRPTH